MTLASVCSTPPATPAPRCRCGGAPTPAAPSALPGDVRPGDVVALYGPGGFGREVLGQIRPGVPGWVDLTFVDRTAGRPPVNGIPVTTHEEVLARPARRRWFNVTVSDSALRARIWQRCVADGLEPVELRAAPTVVGDDVHLGEGAVLAAFVTLDSNVTIGRSFHAHMYSYVAHDCVLGDFVTFAPAVRCNGNVVIGDHAYIGSGAVIRQGRSERQPLVIGAGAVVGMGAVVTRDVAPGTTVVGNPARELTR